MRIGIDGHFLGSHTGGNETQTESLIKSLVEIAPEHKFVVLYTNKNYTPEQNTAFQKAEFHLLQPGAPMWRQLGGSALAFRKLKVDALIAQYWIPFFFPAKITLQVIHDIGHRYFPEHFKIKQRLQLEAAILSGIYRAKNILTVSNHSKQMIINSYGIPDKKIIVISNGVDHNIFSPQPRDKVDTIRKYYGLPQDYLLYVGNLMPRKNIVRLIKAFNILKCKHHIKHSLVIVGQRKWMTKDIFKTAEESSVSKDIIFTGYIKNKDLSAIYSGAAIHVLPSLFEGFGLTLLEAMACGTPVAASDTTSIPEVVGNAGLLFDPLDCEDMAEKIMCILRDASLHQTLINKGKERAKLFTWKQSASKIRDTLLQIDT